MPRAALALGFDGDREGVWGKVVRLVWLQWALGQRKGGSGHPESQGGVTKGMVLGEGTWVPGKLWHAPSIPCRLSFVALELTTPSLPEDAFPKTQGSQFSPVGSLGF